MAGGRGRPRTLAQVLVFAIILSSLAILTSEDLQQADSNTIPVARLREKGCWQVASRAKLLLKLRGGAAKRVNKETNTEERREGVKERRVMGEGDGKNERKGRQLGRRVQLHRAMSKLGLCSRSLAWKAIKEERVKVNGNLTTSPLAWVDITVDQISIDGGKAQQRAPCRVWKVNKPRGLVTARTDDRGRATVFSLFPEQVAKGVLKGQESQSTAWRFPVGRLDQESEGLLLFSNGSDASISCGRRQNILNVSAVCLTQMDN
mmetsp:Transcript_27113/g.42408  ORF Transcript_27113/g.42408 Transcript_27113/m.42408 type:complete len:262 (-) Transcript_27113:540-1325(-)